MGIVSVDCYSRNQTDSDSDFVPLLAIRKCARFGGFIKGQACFAFNSKTLKRTRLLRLRQQLY
jgi:hypothetical protein